MEHEVFPKPRSNWLFWRKRNQGFAWRHYVRTTILVKRKRRREQIDEAKQAALDGLAEAGRAGKAAGRSGIEAAKRGMKVAGREAKEAGARIGEKLAAGAQIAGGAARVAAARAGTGLYALARDAGGKILYFSGKGFGMLAGSLGGLGQSMSPRIGLPLTVAGVAAAIGAITRLLQGSFDRIALSAGLIAIALIGLAALPVIAGRASLDAPFNTRRFDPDAPDADDGAAGWTGTLAAKAVAAILILGVVASLGSFLLPFLGQLPKSFAESTTRELIKGQAKALTGDTMLIGDNRIVLAGIESPETRQSCRTRRGRKWQCGRSALTALRRITGYETVECSVNRMDSAGRKIADCMIGEKNIAAELVRGGHVFSKAWLFSGYGDQQEEAREAGRGIWQGVAQPPAEFRAERWESAKLRAPSGCPIKGKDRARARDKVYILPWSSSYERYRISQKRGDRWFCSEDEALAEGWKPLES